MREDMAECAREVMKVEFSQQMAWANQQDVNRMLAERQKDTVKAAQDWYARYHAWAPSASSTAMEPGEQGMPQRRNSTGQYPKCHGSANKPAEQKEPDAMKEGAQECSMEGSSRMEGKKKIELPPDADDPWGTGNTSGMHAGKWSHPNQYMTVGGSISEPPRLGSDNYEEFRRGLWYWREVNRRFDDSQTISKLAMTADGSLEVITMQYLEITRDAAGSRPLKGAVAKLDAEYSKPAQEKKIEKIGDLMNFDRRSAEDIRSFRARYGKVETHYFLIALICRKP